MRQHKMIFMVALFGRSPVKYGGGTVLSVCAWLRFSQQISPPGTKRKEHTLYMRDRVL